MASALEADAMIQIGETAGAIWHSLAENGPQTIARLVKEIDAPRDVEAGLVALWATAQQGTLQ